MFCTEVQKRDIAGHVWETKYVSVLEHKTGCYWVGGRARQWGMAVHRMQRSLDFIL